MSDVRWASSFKPFTLPPRPRLMCFWRCKLCYDNTYSTDPVKDVNEHLRETHGKGFVCYDRRKRGEIPWV